MYAHGREAVISHLVAGRGVTARGATRRHARGTHGGRFARPDRQTDIQTLSVCLICLILILSYLMCLILSYLILCVGPRPLKCPPPFTAARAGWRARRAAPGSRLPPGCNHGPTGQRPSRCHLASRCASAASMAKHRPTAQPCTRWASTPASIQPCGNQGRCGRPA
jgi:hypothetical protein